MISGQTNEIGNLVTWGEARLSEALAAAIRAEECACPEVIDREPRRRKNNSCTFCVLYMYLY